MDENVFSYNTWTICLYVVWGKKFVHTTYGQVVYMLYEKTFSSIQRMENLSICCMETLSICCIYKDMSYDMEKVHNESIDMHYLGNIYMDIEPIGHNFSFSERENLPYSVLLELISPYTIVITTQCSGWGS